MLLNALVERLKRRSKSDFRGRHDEATLILQAVSWSLRYPLSYRDIEELFRERGLEVDHVTVLRRVQRFTRYWPTRPDSAGTHPVTGGSWMGRT